MVGVTISAAWFRDFLSMRIKVMQPVLCTIPSNSRTFSASAINIFIPFQRENIPLFPSDPPPPSSPSPPPPQHHHPNVVLEKCISVLPEKRFGAW
ncbi:hypothetical protein M0804_008983 [Polistes exclamans]|nr:hypothetical protein M0804_008983 [Polistes exclamans]